jgi:precorrin-2/cobalt-factor-2 C20-methyltransferase
MNQPGSQSKGIFYGVGVGPGDPELLTLKAVRLIQQCDLVTFLASDSGSSMARDIAASVLAEQGKLDRQEVAIVMPMCDSRELANAVYDEAAGLIADHLDNGEDVVFLCQGDPFLFGSFSYLYDRLSDRYAVEVVPGVSSINASAALAGKPLGLLAENVAIISGRRSNDDILQTLQQFDNVAIIKLGRRRAEILTHIAQANRLDDCCYIEYAGHEKQRIVHDIRTLDAAPGPYFSLFLVNRSRDYGPAQ